MRLPGAQQPVPWPDPDDRLVEPESRQEMWRGELVEVAPAEAEHGDAHARLDRVIDQYTADGYIASTDLLTRRDEDSDFATDTSVRKAGDDPETGHRHLEELSFEIFHTQSRGHATRRARDVMRSGVRRLFGIFVGKTAGQSVATVEEWSSEANAWLLRPTGDYIHDPCLVRPLAVEALIDAAAADDACVRALIAKRNPVIEKLQRTHQVKGYRAGKDDGYRAGKDDGYRAGKDDGYRAGKDDGVCMGKREALHHILSLRDIAPSATQRGEIDACGDPARLDRWLERALGASSAAEVLAVE